MPKRFTDTDKWKKPFIRNLEAPYKLLWFYILDDCNHAGIWEVDMEVANLRIGEEIDKETALEKFGDRVQKISESKWFLPDFIFFQYGELNPKNRLHVSVIQILNKYEIKPLRSPLEGVKDKDKDKDKEKDEGGLGETKPEPVPGTLIGEMKSEWKKHNPETFISDHENAGLLEIAKKILKWLAIPGQETDGRNLDPILRRWGELVAHCKADNHLQKYSISQVNNHFSSVTQSFKANGTIKKSSGKGGSQNPNSKAAGANNLLGIVKDEYSRR